MNKLQTHTTELQFAQIERINMTVRFWRFVKDLLPLMVAKGMLEHCFDPDKDPLAYRDVPALVERMKLFLTTEALSTKSRDSVSLATHITKSTVRKWKLLLLQIATRYVREQETLDTVEKALTRVLRFSGDGERGLYCELHCHTAFLITRLKLQSASRVPGAYGAPKIQLLLNNVFRQLPTGVAVEPLLQTMALLQTCFMTGLRIGLLVATNKLDEERLGMRQQDVSFSTLTPGEWTLHVNIKHLKGFNSALNSLSSSSQFLSGPIQGQPRP